MDIGIFILWGTISLVVGIQIGVQLKLKDETSAEK